jgi:hypothetical protein
MFMRLKKELKSHKKIIVSIIAYILWSATHSPQIQTYTMQVLLTFASSDTATLQHDERCHVLCLFWLPFKLMGQMARRHWPAESMCVCPNGLATQSPLCLRWWPTVVSGTPHWLLLSCLAKRKSSLEAYYDCYTHFSFAIDTVEDYEPKSECEGYWCLKGDNLLSLSAWHLHMSVTLPSQSMSTARLMCSIFIIYFDAAFHV